MAQKRLSKFKAKELFDRGYRKCIICKEIKPLELFYKNKIRKGGYDYNCKKCKNEFHRRYRENDYVKRAEYKRNKKYRIKNKERISNKQYLERYGITIDGKIDLLEKQNYRCKICGNKIDITSGHIDHNHKTGEIRGILCKDCNIAIGLFKDNIDNLKKAIKYLDIQ